VQSGKDGYQKFPDGPASSIYRIQEAGILYSEGNRFVPPKR